MDFGGNGETMSIFWAYFILGVCGVIGIELIFRPVERILMKK